MELPRSSACIPRVETSPCGAFSNVHGCTLQSTHHRLHLCHRARDHTHSTCSTSCPTPTHVHGRCDAAARRHRRRGVRRPARRRLRPLCHASAAALIFRRLLPAGPLNYLSTRATVVGTRRHRRVMMIVPHCARFRTSIVHRSRTLRPLPRPSSSQHCTWLPLSCCPLAPTPFGAPGGRRAASRCDAGPDHAPAADGPIHVHVVGAGGYGMAPLAALCLARGWRVSGSDAADSPRLQHLRQQVWPAAPACMCPTALRPGVHCVPAMLHDTPPWCVVDPLHELNVHVVYVLCCCRQGAELSVGHDAQRLQAGAQMAKGQAAGLHTTCRWDHGPGLHHRRSARCCSHQAAPGRLPQSVPMDGSRRGRRH